MEATNLYPYEIDISCLSIMRYCEKARENNTSIIANITYGKIDLLILKKCIPIFAKTSLFDPTDILDINANVSPDNSAFVEISGEINSLINYCLSLSDTEKPEGIFLCGPCSRIDGLSDYISKDTKINSTIIDPFEKITINQIQKYNLDKNSTDFTVCVSLALRGMEVK
jgi:Tfp pilus assembly PilM family ATPase